MKNMSILFALIMSLTGCATGGSSPIYLVRCPALVTYAPADQVRAADELDALPPTAALPQFMADYATLRETCRAIGRVL